jgi:hypothetical protein
MRSLTVLPAALPARREAQPDERSRDERNRGQVEFE